VGLDGRRTEVVLDGAALLPGCAGGAGRSPTARKGAGTDRNAGLDLLRLAAALVIVLFHAKAPGGALMPAALGVFAAMLGLLAMAGADRGGFGALVRRRAGRLLRPFLLWATFYLGLRLVDAAAAQEPILPTLAGWFPPAGTMGPLWFLPFAFLASLAVAAARRAWPATARPLASLSLAAVGSGLWLLGLDLESLPPGIQVFLDYGPALFFGMALAAAGAEPFWLGLTALVAAALGLAAEAAGVAGGQQLYVAVPLIAVALLRPASGTGATRLAAELSMAVYLLHVFVLAVLLRVAPFELGSFALGLAGFAAAAAIGLGLLRTPLGRWLF